MEKINYPCPCGGKIKWVNKEVIMEGVNCGVLDVEICDKCGSEYLPDLSMEIVEAKLEEAGLWGVERTEIKFWKSGKSVVFRVPTNITRGMHLKPHEKAFIYPEGAHRLVIEI